MLTQTECRALLSVLTPQQRLAVERKAEGLTRAETARVLGVSQNRVHNLWTEARKRVRGQLPADLVAFYDKNLMPSQKTTVRAMQLSMIQES